MAQRRPNNPTLLTMETPEATLLFATGGFSEDSDGLSLEYMKHNNFWLTGPNLPYQISFSSAVIIGPEIFVIGGIGQKTNL